MLPPPPHLAGPGQFDALRVLRRVDAAQRLALRRIGEILLSATRGTDVAFRYGGEEFLLLVPGVDLTRAIAVAERVRVATEESVGPPPFTISGGVALNDPADGSDPKPLVRRADTTLYIAKRAGRNRIVADELSSALQRREIGVA